MESKSAVSFKKKSALLLGALIIGGCGGGSGSVNGGLPFSSISNGPVDTGLLSGSTNPSSSGEQVAAVIKKIAYLGDASSYPKELRDSLGGKIVSDAVDADVIAMRIDGTAEQIEIAAKANDRGIPLVIYEEGLKASADFMARFLTWSGDYALVKLGGESTLNIVYEEKDLSELSNDLSKSFAKFTSKDISDRRSNKRETESQEKPAITESTVLNQQLVTSTESYVTTGRKNKNDADWVNATIKIVGVRPKNKKTTKGCLSNWTVVSQGMGFMGKPLFGYSREGDVHKYKIPSAYLTEVIFGAGNTGKLPTPAEHFPGNTQVNGNISYAAGWKFDGNAGFSSDGKVDVGATAGYSSTTTASYDIKDATLTVTPKSTDNKLVYRWEMALTSFQGYMVKEWGAKVFLYRNIALSLSDLLIKEFKDLPPILQAYNPTYTILYSVNVEAESTYHSIGVNYAATVWNFTLSPGVTWNVKDETTPRETMAIQDINVVNCF